MRLRIKNVIRANHMISLIKGSTTNPTMIVDDRGYAKAY